MDNIEYLCDYRAQKDRDYLEYMLRKHSELLSVNVEILAEIGSNKDIGNLLGLLKDINDLY